MFGISNTVDTFVALTTLAFAIVLIGVYIKGQRDDPTSTMKNFEIRWLLYIIILFMTAVYFGMAQFLPDFGSKLDNLLVIMAMTIVLGDIVHAFIMQIKEILKEEQDKEKKN